MKTILPEFEKDAEQLTEDIKLSVGLVHDYAYRMELLRAYGGRCNEKDLFKNQITEEDFEAECTKLREMVLKWRVDIANRLEQLAVAK